MIGSEWRKNRKAYREYMADGIEVSELSDSEKKYIKKRLGRELKTFRRLYLLLDGKMGKLIRLISMERKESNDGGSEI